MDSVPNLFSEGKGVIAEGQLKDKKYFIANKILAKHDENYMPPEVSKALEKIQLIYVFYNSALII